MDALPSWPARPTKPCWAPELSQWVRAVSLPGMRSHQNRWAGEAPVKPCIPFVCPSLLPPPLPAALVAADTGADVDLVRGWKEAEAESGKLRHTFSHLALHLNVPLGIGPARPGRNLITRHPKDWVLICQILETARQSLLFSPSLFILSLSLFWLRHVTCGMLVPQPGVEPMLPAVLQWKHGVEPLDLQGTPSLSILSCFLLARRAFVFTSGPPSTCRCRIRWTVVRLTWRHWR